MKRLGRLWLVVIAGSSLASPSFAEESTETQFLERVRPLTYQGARAGEGYFSPDGTRLIFQSERETDNPFYQIYVLDLTNGDTQRVSPGVGKTTCSFFRPASNDVVFASTHHDPDAPRKQKEELEFRASGKERRYAWDYDETFDVFLAASDGSDVRQITKSRGYDAECAFSPDGSKIVYCSTRDAYASESLSAEDEKRLEMDPSYFGEIYIMDADGGNATRLTDWLGYDGGPFFSPDGKRIVWRHFDETGALADVYTMRLDGSDRQRLTDFGSMCWAPYYHPSGKYVIFTSNKLGFSNFELYIVDVAGRKEPVRITHTDGFDGLPVFAPDGLNLAWTSNRTPSKKSQIFMGDWNHDAALAALAASPSRIDGFISMILAEDIRSSVAHLASDEMEGRMTGTPGAAKAGDYIAERLSEAGIDPVGSSYFHEFPFTAGVDKLVAEDHEFVVLDNDDSENEKEYSLDKDFRPLAFSATGEVEGSIFFAGYGLTSPSTIEQTYDSYADVDVKDKIVMVLRYVPEGVSPERRAELNLYSRVRYKALLAREAGAKALLVVTGPNSPNAGELMSLDTDQSSKSSGIVVASVSADLAQEILERADKDLKSLQDGLDVENPHFEGAFDVPGVTVRVTTSVTRKKKTGRNVVGVIPPAQGKADYVVIGAHYDHIGYGETGSMARKGEEGLIHNGADDNASGTAVVLEIAAALADERKNSPESFTNGVIVALWSGEELGLIGSSHFVANPPVDIERMTAYANFDMVGRMRDNKLIIQGVGSSPLWTELVEKHNVVAGFNLVLQEDPFLPTDASAFYPKEVPVLSFFTGSHEDYNRPTDDWQTLEYNDMERIAVFAFGLIMDLTAAEERPQYVRVERKKEKSSQRGSLRAYLGTIPDYATEGIEGVKISGVRAGGPADKAGLLGGDIIIEFGGRAIHDIYDYTYALDAIKIGTEVRVVVLRDDARVTLTVIPEARK